MKKIISKTKLLVFMLFIFGFAIKDFIPTYATVPYQMSKLLQDVYNYEVESFVLINDIPYIVSDETAYYWDYDDDAWIVYKEGVKKLFRGETFCSLNKDGKLEFGREEYLDTEEPAPLTALYSANQANKLLEINQNTPIKTLNRELSLSCWALCEDGSMLIDPGEEYIPFRIPNETIKDISEKFILTETGNVYQIENRNYGEYYYKQISEDKFIAISAGSDSLCVGIREDNTAVMWSAWTPLELTDWKDVKEIAAGYNYCIGLTMNGKVLYADYDKNREADVSKRLKRIKAEHITCCYETIAVIKKDLTVETIDLSE